MATNGCHDASGAEQEFHGASRDFLLDLLLCFWATERKRNDLLRTKSVEK
jgi:hypothetical protein